MTFSVFLTILGLDCVGQQLQELPRCNLKPTPVVESLERPKKKQITPEFYVASLMSKGAYIKRSVWETERPAVLHNCSPESLSLCGALGASQEIQETWVQSLDWEDPLEKENGNPLQYSCLKNAVDREAWRATV